MSTLLERAKALRKAMDTAGAYLDDEKALEVPEIYALWDEGIEITQEMLDKGPVRFRYKDKLYQVISPHTTQLDWTPPVATSLFHCINVSDEGTLENPIPAELNMIYYKDKYYIENDIIYLCTRDSESALSYLPSQLVGHYFEIVA